MAKRHIPHPQSATKTIEVNTIPEGDVYRLASHSELPDAEKFESWVFDEVLPSIRKHGMYAKDELLDNPDLLLDIVTKLKEEREQRNVLENENKLLSGQAMKWADRPLINALVRAYGHSIGGDYQAAWRDFKKELLYKHGININSRITSRHNATGKKPKTLDMIANEELPQAISTATALCRENGVDISDIIGKVAS